MGTTGRGVDKVGYSITDMFLFQEKKNVMKQCILKISRKVNFIDMYAGLRTAGTNPAHPAHGRAKKWYI